jgi:hypothetical protein
MFGQAEKYLGQYQKVLFTNEGDAPDDWDVLYYNDSLPYQQRVLSCLAKLKDEVVVFHHEDMFLRAEPDHETLKYFANIVQADQVSFIKLLRGGYVDTQVESEYAGLLISPQDMVFTIQPTICKKHNLETMYRETPGLQKKTLQVVWHLNQAIKSVECITMTPKLILTSLQES